MKIGRNDPCPCGSSKKYKNCCLLKERESQTVRNLYIPAEENLRDKILLYLDDERFDWDYENAKDLWYASFGTSKKQEIIEGIWFIVWFIHDYRLSYGKTLLELFYDEMRHNLDGLEAEILEELLLSRLGLYEVNSVKEDIGVELTELFTREKFFAHDVRASHSLIKGDVILTRSFRVRGLNRLQGAALNFPSIAKKTLIIIGEELFKQYRKSKPGASWTMFMKEEGYRFNASHGLLKKRIAEKQLLTTESDELVDSYAVYRVKEFEKTSKTLDMMKEFLTLDEAEEECSASETQYSWDNLKREKDIGEPALRVLSPTSFYSNESEKTKQNWLCYELAMGIYDKIIDEEDKEFMSYIFDLDAIKKFSIHLSKEIGKSLVKNPSGRVDKNYVLRVSKRFFPNLTSRVHDIMFKDVSEAVKELLEICESCPTRCLYEKNSHCTMFDTGGFPTWP